MRSESIYNTHPTVTTINNDTEAWDKNGNVVVLDEDKIATELVRLQAEQTALQFQRDRQYPQLGEQLDLLFHDMTSGKGDKTGEWYKAVLKVKSDNPKPE
jgi:hypothetical protein